MPVVVLIVWGNKNGPTPCFGRHLDGGFLLVPPRGAASQTTLVRTCTVVHMVEANHPPCCGPASSPAASSGCLLTFLTTSLAHNSIALLPSSIAFCGWRRNLGCLQRVQLWRGADSRGTRFHFNFCCLFFFLKFLFFLWLFPPLFFPSFWEVNVALKNFLLHKFYVPFFPHFYRVFFVLKWHVFSMSLIIISSRSLEVQNHVFFV